MLVLPKQGQELQRPRGQSRRNGQTSLALPMALSRLVQAYSRGRGLEAGRLGKGSRAFPNLMTCPRSSCEVPAS